MGILFWGSLAIILAGGMASLALGRFSPWAGRVGSIGVFVGCLMGLAPAMDVILTGAVMSWSMEWRMPYGSFSCRIDALSAFFLIPIFLVSGVSALYGSRYLRIHETTKNLGASWFFYSILVVSMALVVVARNGVLFLVVWEIMSLASFFLVTFEHEKESVRQAGWIYLTATHLGTVFLLVLFVVLAREAGSMDFDRFEAMRFHSAAIAGPAFIFAVIGFGTKAGFIPFHVWLPEAHPAAPSHVSALMSGVMIKTGIYGLVRTLTFLSPPQIWWGWLLVGVGLTSGVIGVLFALAQHDLKRLLAYHSVENIGIIALGLGLGLIGTATHQPVLACLGFGGGLLHVLNHALFKGLLFLGAGSVLHATGTREMDRLGGLIKRMPWTSATFAAGSVAICGLPPLNGFISEFLIYVGAYHAMGRPDASIPSAGVIVGLAMIGTLAVACFTKVLGVVFLGEPRTEAAAKAHESDWAMRVPMVLLALGCVAVAAAAPWIVGLMSPVVAGVAGIPAQAVKTHLRIIQGPLESVTWMALLLIFGIAILVMLRKQLLAGRPVDRAGTWDCGYVMPSARMQYTSSSYAKPLIHLFDGILQTKTSYDAPVDLFPSSAGLHTHTEDVFRRRIYEPLFHTVDRFRSSLRWMQEGRVQVYILYIAVTLVVLLIGGL